MAKLCLLLVCTIVVGWADAKRVAQAEMAEDHLEEGRFTEGVKAEDLSEEERLAEGVKTEDQIEQLGFAKATKAEDLLEEERFVAEDLFEEGDSTDGVKADVSISEHLTNQVAEDSEAEVKPSIARLAPSEDTLLVDSNLPANSTSALETDFEEAPWSQPNKQTPPGHHKKGGHHKNDGKEKKAPPGHHKNDVECLCIDRYEYVDFDDYGDHETMDDCTMHKGGEKRCNEICEEDPEKHVTTLDFEPNYRQTVSFCGTDEGEYGPPFQCHCLDMPDTIKHSNQKRAWKKHGRDFMGLSQFKDSVSRVYKGFGNANKNLRACYEGCPGVCSGLRKLLGGCAMPIHAR